MEYHKDRFNDFSLLIFKDEKLVALMPANRKDAVVYSHAGLTYGGILFKKGSKFFEVWEVYKTIFKFLEQERISSLVIKEIPSMYTSYPAEELSYLVYMLKAKLLRTDIASSILIKDAIKIQSNRKEGIKKAERAGLEIKQDANFELFWNEILIPNLQKRHSAKPVHSVSEIQALQHNFPKNIHQFNVYQDNTIVAGATIFETHKVAHVQYISANENRQELGALDFLFHYLITEKYKEKAYFDFGTSNENNGKNINKGLLYWKECFGARAIAHRYFEFETANHHLMDSVFI